jgi:glutamate dehydrogenase
VLCGLALSDDQFIKYKEVLVKEILERLAGCAENEAQVLIRSLKKSSDFLTDISLQVSERINLYTYQILDYLDSLPCKIDGSGNDDFDSAITRCFLSYCLPTLRTKFKEDLLLKVPVHHKKAIVACHVAAQQVYQKGVDWEPTIVEILPVLLRNM